MNEYEQLKASLNEYAATLSARNTLLDSIRTVFEELCVTLNGHETEFAPEIEDAFVALAATIRTGME